MSDEMGPGHPQELCLKYLTKGAGEIQKMMHWNSRSLGTSPQLFTKKVSTTTTKRAALATEEQGLDLC